jgi:hypothetical protein
MAAVSRWSEELMVESGEDVREAPRQGRQGWILRKPGAIPAVLLLFAGAVAASLWSRSTYRSTYAPKDPNWNSEKLEINSAQTGWQIDMTERDLCSKTSENCINSKCCKTTDYRCFKKNDTYAKCMDECKEGSCEVVSRKVIFTDARPAKSLFCFAVYTQNTGTTKQNFEKEILTEACARKWHVFSCDAHAVYSDVEVSLCDGYTTGKVYDVDNTFHVARRKETGAWINTGMFQQVWKAIAKAGTYRNYDWTVKADADAVFLPYRLVARVAQMPRATTGVILTNCPKVDYGFFGSLEVFSKTAFDVLLANLDKCNKALPWILGLKGGKFGPMGEDLFAEICMEKNGVFKIEAFDITTDGACPADRPKDQKKNKKWKANCAQTLSPAMHPFKKTYEWVQCYTATSVAI